MKKRLEIGLVVVVGSKHDSEFWVDIPKDVYDNEEGHDLIREFLAPGEALDHPVDTSLPHGTDQRFRVVLKSWSEPRKLPGFTPSTTPDIHMPKWASCPTASEVWDAMMSFAAEKEYLTTHLASAK